MVIVVAAEKDADWAIGNDPESYTLGASEVISDTAPHIGAWKCLRVAEGDACIITAITFDAPSPIEADEARLRGKALKAGDRLHGPITSVTLASGKAYLHK